MKPYIIYFRHEEIYNGNPCAAVYTNSFLADMLTKGARVSTYVVAVDKTFSNGSKYFGIKTEPCEAMLTGSIPYHLLVANLYRLEEEGFEVFIDARYIKTEKENPDYPNEFVREWKEDA